MPNSNTIWQTTSNKLTPSSPVTLFSTNENNITYKIHYSIDNDYMFDITQEIENKSQKSLEVFPYRLIKRINLPKTINFFILHEGFVGILNDELIEKKYKHIAEDCTTTKKI